MREYPKGGIIGKTVRVIRRIRALKVPLYAANACYFIVLAVFPALLLLLSLLRYIPLEVEKLGEMLYGILPEPLAAGGEELILLTWDNITGTVVGVSAVTALWSAGRGIYGVLTGLNAIYGVRENRGYFHTRFLSAVYLFAFLLVMILTLGLHLTGNIPETLQFPMLLVFQTIFFAVMFTVLPAGENEFSDSLPGAVLAAFGWQIFSDLYAVYVDHFSHLSSIYGSVYAIALSMLWLYCCMSIVFYGGALNVLLKAGENMSQQ